MKFSHIILTVLFILILTLLIYGQSETTSFATVRQLVEIVGWFSLSIGGIAYAIVHIRNAFRKDDRALLQQSHDNFERLARSYEALYNSEKREKEKWQMEAERLTQKILTE